MDADGRAAPRNCPVCGDRLALTRLSCHACGTELSGSFAACEFCAMGTDDLALLRVFLASRGNLKEVERRQRIHETSRDAERRGRRQAAYERASATCPVPLHPEPLPLPGSLRLQDDEFLVAASSRPVKGDRLTLTTQRLIYTRGNDAQLVLYLADICDVAFHADGSATIGTPSGRWERLSLSGNNLAASRDGLLALVHHARAERSALPGGLDELVELRDRGAIGAAEFEARRGAAAAAPRRRRQRQVEVAGKPTPRATTAPAADESAIPAPPDGGAQPSGEGG